MSDEPVTPWQRELLERRAERLAAPEASTVEEAMAWVAQFSLGDDLLALPLEQLRAAVPLSLVTPVPLSDSHVIGVLRHHGEIISALSLASLLGGRGWRHDPTVLLVVSPGPGRVVALDCEQTPRAIALPKAAVEAAATRDGAVTREVLTAERRVIHLIDLDALLERRSEARRAR